METRGRARAAGGDDRARARSSSVVRDVASPARRRRTTPPPTAETTHAPAAERRRAAEPDESDRPSAGPTRRRRRADIEATDRADAARADADDRTGTPAEPRPAAPRTVGRHRRRRAARRPASATRSPCPGESFLGLLDGFEAAGINVVATRHEGGAAFMAEAHGQLTGRPAACLGTRAVGASNLAIGIHTARQDSTPDVRDRRPGRARASRPRGVPGDRPVAHDRRPGQVGRRAARRRCRPGRWRGDPAGLERTPRPGAALVRGGPARRAGAARARASTRAGRPRPDRATRRSAPSSSCWHRPSARSSSPAAACCARERSTELLRFAELLQRPGDRRAGVART